MPVGIGASGILGVAHEATAGTYLAPTKFIPILSENLKYVQDTVWRRPIRNALGLLGAVPGNVHIEGDVEMEALTDTVVYFLHAAHTTVTKSGTGPYTYTYKASQAALPVKTLSITVVRNGAVFGYTGVTVGGFEFTIDDGMLKFTAHCLGLNEASQTAPTPTWPTSVPFGAGSYAVQIPTATQVFDMDTFTFASDDSASAEYRLKSAGARGAQFIRFGENTVTLECERDFVSRTEYDNYKALTAQAITIICTIDTNNSIQFDMPVAVADTYEVGGLTGQDELIRASITYNAVMDGTGNTYTIAVKAGSENIV